jgi:hypothetical protein
MGKLSTQNRPSQGGHPRAIAADLRWSSLGALLVTRQFPCVVRKKQTASGAQKTHAFIQDDWKPKANLPLTLEIRWVFSEISYCYRDLCTEIGNPHIPSAGGIDSCFATLSSVAQASNPNRCEMHEAFD